MKKILLLTISILNIYTGYSQVILQKLDELITTYVKLNKFNGSLLIAQGGKILLEKGYGFKNFQDQTLNDPHTIFQIGSITKQFTAAVILKLVEQKRLSLTDKLDKYYPGFPKGNSITLQNLLTHTSGIFDYTHVAGFMQQSEMHTDERKVLAFLKSKPLDFPPGEKYSYSNSGYMLLAYIIQKVTHQTYETNVRKLIFKPLHMAHSGFDFSGLNDSNKAKGYTEFSAAELTEGPAIDSTEFIGSGEIYSTVGDLYLWHRALQAGKILSKVMQEQAYHPFKGLYGYGWQLDTVYHKKMVWHAGGMFGFRSIMTRIPEDNVFVLLLNNHSDEPFLWTISKKILAIIYGQHYTLPEQPIIIGSEILKAYTGTYTFDPNHTLVVSLINGHLFGISSGKTLELIPIKKNYFHFMEKEGEEGDIEFETDKNGNIIGMSLIGGQGRLTSKKVQ